LSADFKSGTEGAGEESGGEVHERREIVCRPGRSSQSRTHSAGQCYGITAGLSGPGALGEPADESDAGRFSQPIDVGAAKPADVDAAKPADVGAVAFRQPAIPGRAVGVAEPDEGG